MNIEKTLWRMLMWFWVRRAKRAYGGPGERGELFNTACFQQAAGKTTGQTVGEQASKMWLVEYGLVPGHGGCHWFKRTAETDTWGQHRKVER